MIDAIQIAATGLRSNETMLDSISNNIANINTPGFKRSRVHFNDLVYSSPIDGAATKDNKSDNAVGVGVAAQQVNKDFGLGSIISTGQSLDLAIHGRGFVEVELPDGGVGYTRNLELMVDKDGYISTQTGFRLSNRLQVPPDAEGLVVQPDGRVEVTLNGGAESSYIGDIELANFSSPEGLAAFGNNLYQATEASGVAMHAKPGDLGAGSLMQGYIEGSNVELTSEMVTMMTTQRAYQLNARLLQISDQLLETINNVRR
jgi:flagellar basal-body rod protein FlgG